MPVTAIWIPAANCVLRLHQLVIGPVIVHFLMVLKCTHRIICIALNVLQIGRADVFQLGNKPQVQRACFLPTKTSGPPVDTNNHSLSSKNTYKGDYFNSAHIHVMYMFSMIKNAGEKFLVSNV